MQWISSRGGSCVRKLLLVSVSLVVMLFALGVGPGRSSVEAAPAGAATGQVVTQQTCLANGFVQVTFLWNPSGLGLQWMDVSASPVFNGYANFGPLASNTNAFNWAGLLPNTTYYSRISTWVGFWLTSDTIAFTTGPCGGAFTPPSNPTTTILGPNSVLFQWTAGLGNQYYCVDTAFSLGDLTTFSGSWHNWGCGTTSTSIEVDSIACGIPHFWRVYAWGPGGSGYSTYSTFQTPGCGFTPPTNLRNFNVTPTSAGFRWDRGVNNYWYCVDIAKSQGDLTSLTGSWMNFGCGTTGTQASTSGLSCGTTYYWRVWAAGPGTSGYSLIDTMQTGACPLLAPTNLDTVISSSGVTGTKTVTFSWDEPTATSFTCVDYAQSQSDLTNFGATWHNACTTSTSISLVLNCGQTYYWRAYAFLSPNTSAYSNIEMFSIPSC